MTENEKAPQKPVPKAGMGFFVMGDRSQWFSDTFFKWPGLIGKGNKVKAFNLVPSFTEIRIQGKKILCLGHIYLKFNELAGSNPETRS